MSYKARIELSVQPDMLYLRMDIFNLLLESLNSKLQKELELSVDHKSVQGDSVSTRQKSRRDK